jgi:hypothetical protein
MARPRRFTVRLVEPELAAIQAFANDHHVIASAAVRRLISLGLAAENRTRLGDILRRVLPGQQQQIS